MIPKDPNFTISPEATKVNGWTKESLIKAYKGIIFSFWEVWSLFLCWLKDIGFDIDKDIYLCAYNGYHFHFRMLVCEFRRAGLEKTRNFKLLDPCLDWKMSKNETLELDEAFKQTSINSR